MSAITIGTDANSLVFTSAFYHPDSRLRASLLPKIKKWIDSLHPHYRESDVRKIIETENGTILEPFILKSNDVSLASLLAQAAFSRTIEQTRFRIVSRDTIGSESGLVITNNLNNYYAERYAFGKRRRSPKSGFTFIPNLLPENPTHSLRKIAKCKSKLVINDKGVSIYLPFTHNQQNSIITLRKLQKYSQISNVDRSFSQIGLRIDDLNPQSNYLEIRTGSPESQIKFITYMMNKEVMQLTTGDDDDGIPHIFIALNMPTNSEVLLKTVFTLSNHACNWMHCSFIPAIPISREEKTAISRWLPPHISWVEEIWDGI